MAAMPAAVVNLLDLGMGEIILIGNGGLRCHLRLVTIDVQVLMRNQQRRGAGRGGRSGYGTCTGGNADSEFQEFTTFHVSSSDQRIDGTIVPHEP